MTRPVKKTNEQWRKEILEAAQALFITKGYEETSVADIMKAVGGAKGMFYRCFESKEELMLTLGEMLFLDNNPFDAVMECDDLNGLQKIRRLLRLNQADSNREKLNLQSISILKDRQFLMMAVESNRQVLTPLWRRLLDEGIADGSIKTEYVKELSELLAIVNFWLLPSVYPDTTDGICHKFRFVQEIFTKMGLPLWDEELSESVQQVIVEMPAE